LAPAVTETCFALDAGERIVGVTSFDREPPAVRQRPIVGGFLPNTLNLEAILALRPDLLITAGDFQKPFAQRLEAFNIPYWQAEPKTIAELLSLVRTCGQLAEAQPQAEALVANFERELQQLEARVQTRPATRPTVLFLVGVDPLIAAGPTTYLGEAITKVGGQHWLESTVGMYPRVSEESILARPPDYILGLTGEHGGILEQLKTRSGWRDLAVVRQQRLIRLTDDLVARPGPRFLQGLQEIEVALFPAGNASPK
jgi:iron complex transport system substrate-binding protein